MHSRVGLLQYPRTPVKDLEAARSSGLPMTEYQFSRRDDMI